MSRTCLLTALVVLATTVWSADETTVILKPAMIKAPQLILSHGDQNGAGILKGHVLTGHKLTVQTNKGSSSLGVSGVIADLSVSGGKLQISVDNKAPLTQNISNLASDPLVLPLPEKRKYVVAFPLIYSYMTSFNIYYRSGFYMGGKLAGKDFWLYDDNVDGVFDTGDTYQNGNCMVFAPLKTLVTNGSKVFAIGAIEEHGEQATFTPHKGETAAFDIKYLGPKLHAAWETDSGLTFTTARNAESLTVTKGKVQLLYGLTLDEKNVPCAIVYPDKMPEVDAQDKVTHEFGTPFHFTYQAQIAGKKLNMSASSARLFGDKGEEYRFFDIEGVPKLSVMTDKGPKQFDQFEFG